MISSDDVKKLAALARLGISDAELESASKKIDSILTYVGQISSALTSSDTERKDDLINVMREDGEPHESGMHTETLLDSAPFRKDQHLKVKKILS